MLRILFSQLNTSHTNHLYLSTRITQINEPLYMLYLEQITDVLQLFLDGMLKVLTLILEKYHVGGASFADPSTC